TRRQGAAVEAIVFARTRTERETDSSAALGTRRRRCRENVRLRENEDGERNGLKRRAGNQTKGAAVETIESAVKSEIGPSAWGSPGTKPVRATGLPEGQGEIDGTNPRPGSSEIDETNPGSGSGQIDGTNPRPGRSRIDGTNPGSEGHGNGGEFEGL